MQEECHLHRDTTTGILEHVARPLARSTGELTTMPDECLTFRPCQVLKRLTFILSGVVRFEQDASVGLYVRSTIHDCYGTLSGVRTMERISRLHVAQSRCGHAFVIQTHLHL